MISLAIAALLAPAFQGTVPNETNNAPAAVPYQPIYSIELPASLTGTGYAEKFLAYGPEDQSKPRPLLVIFHKWGVSQMDALVNTPFFHLARDRRWHVLAPLSASGLHVNSFQGQTNTELAMDWMLANFNVNRTRIYGVGFSMGGGAVCNFAARHLDPNRFMFAALVNHTGSVAQNISYENEDPGPWPLGAQGVWDFWFGVGQVAPPDPFSMLRTSLIDFDLQTQVVDNTTDMARNLTHVPLKVSRASNEPRATAHLATQSDVLVNHMTGLGAIPEYQIVPYTEHAWASLDFNAAVSFLNQSKLRIPTNADTLADQDGVYFYFYVHQDAPGAFTPFSWSINEVQNKILIWKTQNLKQLDVDLSKTGLSVATTLQVVLKSKDGLPDDVLIQGWPAAPTDALRDGVSQLGMGTYGYDAQKQELLIQEWDGGQHIWDVVP